MGPGGDPDLRAVDFTLLYGLGKNVASCDGQYLFSFGSPEPELSLGRLSKHHHPDNMKGSLGGKAPMKSTSLGVSQQGGTASSLLKTCLLVGKLVFWRSLFSFFRHQIRSLGRRRPESLGSKEIEMGIEARSLGLLLITTHSPYATSWSCKLKFYFILVGWML